MALLMGIIVVIAASIVASWAWSYQSQVLEAVRPAQLLRRLEVRITAVLVHDKSVIVGMRDEGDGHSLHTLVVAIGGHRHGVVATLEEWCSDGARLQLDRIPSGRNVHLRHLNGSRTLALRLAA
jgi:hypothetical protein